MSLAPSAGQTMSENKQEAEVRFNTFNILFKNCTFCLQFGTFYVQNYDFCFFCEAFVSVALKYKRTQSKLHVFLCKGEQFFNDYFNFLIKYEFIASVGVNFS